MAKKITLVFSLVLLTTIGFYYFALNPKVDVYGEGSEINQELLDSETGYYDGSEDAEIEIIVFSDYNCVACLDLHKMIKEHNLTYKLIDTGKVKITFKDVPTNKVNSRNAAKAAIAAREQSSYYEMQDLIFSDDSWLEREDERLFYNFANQLKLDMNKFQNDLNSDETVRELKRIEQEFNSFGFIGTPTLIINGIVHNGVPDNIDSFLDLLEIEL